MVKQIPLATAPGLWSMISLIRWPSSDDRLQFQRGRSDLFRRNGLCVSHSFPTVPRPEAEGSEGAAYAPPLTESRHQLSTITLSTPNLRSRLYPSLDPIITARIAVVTIQLTVADHVGLSHARIQIKRETWLMRKDSGSQRTTIRRSA